MPKVTLIPVIVVSAVLAIACLGSSDRATPSPTVTLSPMPSASVSPQPSASPLPQQSPSPLEDIGLYAISPDGGDPRLIVGGMVRAALSPVDNLVATAPFCGDPGAISITSIDSGEATVRTTFDGIVIDIAWSPDGSALLAGVQSRGQLQQRPLVYLLDMQGVHDPVELFEGDYPVWSPNSQKVAYNFYSDGAYDLRIFDLANSTSTSVQDNHVLVGDLAWSPDSERIAYSSSPSDSYLDPNVQIVSADGTVRRTIAEHARVPVWSQDGQYVYVTIVTGRPNAANPNWPIAQVDPDTDAAPVILSQSGGVVSPDETVVVAYTGWFGTEGAIEIVGLEDDDSLVFSSDVMGFSSQFAFSPMGGRIAFGAAEINTTNSKSLYVMGSDGSSLIKLFTVSHVLGNIRWSSDGNWLLFSDTVVTSCVD